VSWNDRGCIRDVLKNWPLPEEARICVVTDGSRILGKSAVIGVFALSSENS
jgi:malate dehydrogenase (oxaloacetate-decarboxylating)(NADP+)